MIEHGSIYLVEVRIKKEKCTTINSMGNSFKRFDFNPICPICLRENHITMDCISLFGLMYEDIEEEFDFKLHPAYKTCRHYLYHFSDPMQHPAEDYVFCKTAFVDA